MWACAVLGFPPDKARSWTPTPSPVAGAECRSPTKAAPARFVFAEYLAIAHLKADELVTVDLELAAGAEKVTQVASIQDWLQPSSHGPRSVFGVLRLRRVSCPQT
jgi:hypothetical protein